MFQIIPLCALLTAPFALAEPAADDRAVLTRLKTTLWPQAYRTRDRALLAQILDDEFQLINQRGQWSDKAQELQRLPDYDWPHEDFSYTIKRLDIYHGHTAIVAGEGRAHGRDADGVYCLRYQSSNVLIKRDAGWQAVSSHVSGVHSECDETQAK